MVRIIEIPPLVSGELQDQVRDRKRVITNITIRSNQQNPMKRWNLVSNDDYQMGLYRFFRRHDYFYQRREREWSRRSRELRNIGVEKGPGIKLMAQLVASFYPDKKDLGPAKAKQSVAKLFEEVAYEQIRKTTPELAFQLFLVSENIDDVYGEVAKRNNGLRDVERHANLTRFAVVTKAMRLEGAGWGRATFTEHLLGHWGTWDDSFDVWRKLVEEAARTTLNAYRDERRRQGPDLTMNNFFKTQSYVDMVMAKANNRELKKLARQVL